MGKLIYILSLMLSFTPFTATNTTCQCWINQQCIKCQSGYLLNIQNQTCQLKSTCDNGYYQSQDEIYCLNCNSKCLTCNDGLQTNCTSCLNTLLLNGQCLNICPSSYYTINDTCQPCHSSCQNCTCSNLNCCTACNNQLYRYNTSCYLKCPVGYFGNSATGNCTNKCSNSKWGNSVTGICEDYCPDPYLSDIKNQICVLYCPYFTYKDINSYSCNYCASNCQKCQGPNIIDCQQCGNYTYMMDDNTCGNCPQYQYPNNNQNICSIYLEFSVWVMEINNLEQYVNLLIVYNQQIDSSTLQFDESITVNDLIRNRYQIKQLIIQTDQSYLITIQFLYSHNQTQIELNFSTVSGLDGTIFKNDTGLQNVSLNAQLSQQEKEMSFININKIITKIFLIIIIIIFFICKLIDTQVSYFYIIANQIQGISLFSMLNVQFPNPVISSLLQLLRASIQPQVIGSTTSLYGTQTQYLGVQIINQLPQNNFYLQAGFSYNFFQNGGLQLFLCIIIMWIVWFVIFAFKNFYEIQKNKLYIYIFSSIFRIINEVLIRTHELFFYPITTFFALQILGANFQDSFNKGSFVLAIFVMLYFLYYYYRYYHTINKDNEEPTKIFSEFFYDFHKKNDDKNDQDNFYKKFLFIQCGYKWLFVLSLVFLNEWPMIQFGVCLTIQIFYFILLLIKRPFHYLPLNFIAIISQFSQIILMFNILVGQIFYSRFKNDVNLSDNSQASNYYLIGVIFVVFLQLLIVTYCLIFILNKVKDYRIFVMKNPKWIHECVINIKKLINDQNIDQQNQQNDKAKLLKDKEGIEMNNIRKI